MGRIIPYIMENNPNVPNHQPVYIEVSQNGGTPHNSWMVYSGKSYQNG
jgi:hypothetical protein